MILCMNEGCVCVGGGGGGKGEVAVLISTWTIYCSGATEFLPLFNNILYHAHFTLDNIIS